MSEAEGFLIEEVQGKRKKGNGFSYEYLIKWQGFVDSTWEPMENCPADMVLMYERHLAEHKTTDDRDKEAFDLDIDVEDRIIEQELGKYSGMNYDEVKTYPNYETNSLNRWDWTPEGGGESYSDIEKRVTSFFQDLDVNDKSNILIVTHAVTFRLIRAVLENSLPKYPKDFPNNG